MLRVATFSTANFAIVAANQQSKGQGVSADTDGQTKVEHQDSAVNVTLSAAASSSASAASGETADFATVAKNARAVIDAGYEKTGTSSSIHTQGSDWIEIMGGLDRRSLYAIASNEGGHFTQMEQEAAHYFMAEQQAQAMKAADPNGTDPTSAYKAAIQFLDNVSPEEKSSFAWAKSRAIVEVGYEGLSRRDGKEDKSLSSDHPLVKMLKQAMYRLSDLHDATKTLEDMPEYADALAAHRGERNQFLDKTA